MTTVNRSVNRVPPKDSTMASGCVIAILVTMVCRATRNAQEKENVLITLVIVVVKVFEENSVKFRAVLVVDKIVVATDNVTLLLVNACVMMVGLGLTAQH